MRLHRASRKIRKTPSPKVDQERGRFGAGRRRNNDAFSCSILFCSVILLLLLLVYTFACIVVLYPFFSSIALLLRDFLLFCCFCSSSFLLFSRVQHNDWRFLFFVLIPSSVNESATIRVWMLARAMAVADSLGDGLENTSATKEQSNCYICVDRDGDGFTGRRQDTLMIIMSAVVTMSFKLSGFVHVNVGDPCLVSLIIAYQSWYWG
jgi:hypothetical protein